jgi:hypothetical protein
MTNTPWILTEVHRNPDCLEWIISTSRPANNGCKADPRIAIFDEMGGSGDGRREGRLNAILATTAPELLKGIINARRALAFFGHSPERRIMEANEHLKRAHRTLTLLRIRANA